MGTSRVGSSCSAAFSSYPQQAQGDWIISMPCCAHKHPRNLPMRPLSSAASAALRSSRHASAASSASLTRSEGSCTPGISSTPSSSPALLTALSSRGGESIVAAEQQMVGAAAWRAVAVAMTCAVPDLALLHGSPAGCQERGRGGSPACRQGMRGLYCWQRRRQGLLIGEKLPTSRRCPLSAGISHIAWTLCAMRESIGRSADRGREQNQVSTYLSGTTHPHLKHGPGDRQNTAVQLR